MLDRRRLIALAACALALAGVGLPAAGAAPEVKKPAITWHRVKTNYTRANRPVTSIRTVVVHVTEGGFWGSVRWLQNERAHASSHFVVSRSGKIAQLVRLQDVAWHAGNGRMNARSVGIEHVGWTYDPAGFTERQYEASARLVAWIARRTLLPIDRRHIIGHAHVPAPGGGRGGSGHHTDPGPSWRWDHYLDLVRRFAYPRPTLRVEQRLQPGPLRGVVPWHAVTKGGARRVEFAVDGRVLWIDRRAPFSFLGGLGLNTVGLANGRHVLELRAFADGTRHDVVRRTVVVTNRAFALTTGGARPWRRVRGVVRLRVRVWGAKAESVVVRIDGDRLRVDRRAPYVFRWDSRRRRDGRHVLSIRATSVDGRVATRRVPVVASNRPRPAPTRPVTPRIAATSLADGATVSGFVVWRAQVTGAVRVEFRVDGRLLGTDVRRPFTVGWDTTTEAPGPHALSITAIGGSGRTTQRSLTVVVSV